MRDRPYKLFLEDIIESIRKIQGYTKGLSFEDFKNDSKTVDAVLRNLEIIGEASRSIPPETRSKYPDIPWGRMVGLRNIVSHGYFGIDLLIIWQIVATNLPEVEPRIMKIIETTRTG